MVDAGAELLLAFPGKWVSSFSMARDGTAVIALNEGWVNLFAIDVARDQTATSPVQLTVDAVVNTRPDYGPDGRIAYEQHVVGQPISAWSIDERGQHKAPISTGLSVSVRAPQWDADARRVFVLATEPGSADARSAWIDPQTRRLAFISGPPCRLCNPPHLSPDARRIAFHLIGSDGVMNVWIRHLDDGSERQVTFDSEAMRIRGGRRTARRSRW
jgi:hypothetical protein